MVGASTDIVQIGNYPAKQKSVWPWYLDFHRYHRIGHSGSYADVSHQHGLGEQNKQQNIHVTKEAVNDIFLPLHKALTLMIHTYQHGCMSCHKLLFTYDTRFLHAGIGSTGFFLTEVLFFHEPPESPIVGASDIGQVSAYTCKLHKLPLGTSKGLFHFVEYKWSTKNHKIEFLRK